MQAIPSQRQLVLPLLEAVSKAGGTATTSEARDAIAQGLGLDEEARTRRVTIGGQDHGALAHRVRWAQQHARLAGLLVRGDDGWSITP